MFGFFKNKETSSRAAEPDARLVLYRLRDTFRETLESLKREALEAGPTGSDAWDMRMISLGLRVEDYETRRSHAQEGFAQHCGAPLEEVTRAIRRLCENTRQELDAIQGLDPFCPEQREFEHELHHLPDTECEAYAAQVKPKADLGSVFATALNTSQGYMAKMGTRKVETLRCTTCGSPRANEQEILCRYCGSELFQ